MIRAALVLAFIGGGAMLSAQAPEQPLLAFEVASVKPSTGDGPGMGWRSPPRGTVAITNAPLRSIITRTYGIAFNLERYAFEAPSNKVLLTRFDIIANPQADAPPGQTIVMLKNLLAERFKLRVHTETRQVPVYALTVSREGRLGENLRQSPQDCELPSVVQALADTSLDITGRSVCRETATVEDAMRVMSGAGPIALLVQALQRSSDRPLIDSTGLTGNYEWQLRFSAFQGGGVPFARTDGMFTAVEEQLGLKVEPRMGAIDVLVVDSVEMPTPN
jgi:uncharacterized protein (TIGR03435 family)